MNRHKSKVDELERRLYSAYGSPGGVALGAGWRQSVMREIRARSASQPAERAQAFVVGLAWRLSAAAGLVAILLLVYIVANGLVDYQDLAMRYLENPIDFLI
jgi:hypothetical protein